MTEEEQKSHLINLINHNGGWFVLGSFAQLKPGAVIIWDGVENLVVLSESSEAKGLKDVEYLGLPIEYGNRRPYYYRMTID